MMKAFLAGRGAYSGAYPGTLAKSVEVIEKNGDGASLFCKE
jgi:hypothetical protein